MQVCGGVIGGFAFGGGLFPRGKSTPPKAKTTITTPQTCQTTCQKKFSEIMKIKVAFLTQKRYNELKNASKTTLQTFQKKKEYLEGLRMKNEEKHKKEGMM